MDRLRVLITNIYLQGRTGTELYVRDLALQLLDLGHAPVVYAPRLGEVAEEIRRATIPVVDDLDRIEAAPDVIHGHHSVQTMTALLRFPDAPAIFVCHDNLGWHDRPPRFPRILRYVAVDETCRERLIGEYGVPEDRVRVIRNFVDLSRFLPRPPLPARPGRALVFSNYMRAADQLSAIQEACKRSGISVDIAGSAAGAQSAQPEVLLRDYDLVFAKARCALEAMAVGAAVILCDATGSGPMVTSAEVERLGRYNFGMRLLRAPVRADILAHEIERYDAADAAEVSRQIRCRAGLSAAAEEFVDTYEEVIREHRAGFTPDRVTESRATATFLRSIIEGQIQARLDAEYALGRIADSAWWRLRERIRRIPVLGGVVQGGGRSPERR